MAENGSRKDRKKLNLKVKKEFQSWMLKQVLLAVAISSVVAAIILYFYARQEVVDSFFTAHVKIRRVSDLLLPVVFAGSVVSLVVGVVLSLFLPQKIAGPIYRIEQSLEKIGDGDLTTNIKLRDKDRLKDLAENVNKATFSLRVQVHEAKAVCMELEKAYLDNDDAKVSELMQRQKELIAKLIT
ncbi:HAMP domain-containing protein [Malonomonas rubra DSM 5091]|uniref:HAMP domain-containing protein n=1 Tax=Malonomonas rubra DSM 5091 TaxID=1122189 RepID=A0A1M6BYI7_MALRU|nr:methyl-accepting chemotaxis protein [Malonomonas rubra]SHI53767.1 HAMP domain-containing protein [Malonomonas rubra DSM 5091]